MFNEFADNKTIRESLEFLENCELGSCDHSFHPQSRLMAFDVDEKDPEALIINDTIASIAAGMSKENKQIVKDTLLFATLAANAADPTGGAAWYRQHKAVLNFCGWGNQQWAVRDYQSRHSRFTMDQVALEILGSAITAAALPGPTSLLLLKVAKDTVTALQRNEKPLRLFESSSNQSSGAKFAIASSAESLDGDVVMAMGAVSFKTRLDVTNVLFWDWIGSSVDIMAAEDHVFMNRRHYEDVRHVVEGKLTASARKFLENIEF